MVNMFVSLDGVIQGPGLPDEDREGGFEHGGWQAPYFDEESGKVITEHTARLEALLLGRKTYEIFATYWPQAAASDPIAARLNSAPKYVASRTLDTVEWNNSKLIEGDVADAVAGLKRDHGQIDVTGSGKRLFPDGTVPTALRLVESATFPKGAVLLAYQRTGKPTYGSMA
jgi:dihydrofolate reductase